MMTSETHRLADEGARINALKTKLAKKDARITALEETIIEKDIRITALETENRILKEGVEPGSTIAVRQNTPKEHARQTDDNHSDTLYVTMLKTTISELQKKLKDQKRKQKRTSNSNTPPSMDSDA